MGIGTDIKKSAIVEGIRRLVKKEVMAVYTVRWCNREGNLQELQYKTLSGAELEALALDLHFDGVEIIDPSGKSVWTSEPESTTQE